MAEGAAGVALGSVSVAGVSRVSDHCLGSQNETGSLYKCWGHIYVLDVCIIVITCYFELGVTFRIHG